MKAQRWDGVLQKAACVNSDAKLSRMGSAKAPLKVSKNVNTGAAAAASQEVLSVSQASIPW